MQKPNFIYTLHSNILQNAFNGLKILQKIERLCKQKIVMKYTITLRKELLTICIYDFSSNNLPKVLK